MTRGLQSFFSFLRYFATAVKAEYTSNGFFGYPCIDGLVVHVSGGVDWGTYKACTILWDWGDQSSAVWEDAGFVNSHTYSATGTYTVSVRAMYGDNQYSENTISVTIDGTQHGGVSVTIDNNIGYGSISYYTSNILGLRTVYSGDKVTLYLAQDDTVWGIEVTPDSGYSFASQTVDPTTIIATGFTTASNPVTITADTANSAGETISPNLGPAIPLPEYAYGSLIVLGACFAALAVFKKRSSISYFEKRVQ